MTTSDYIGIAAAVFTTVCQLPQTIKVVRTREVHSISLPTYAMLNVGIALWIAYGACVGDVPLVVSNLLTLLMTGTIMGYKIAYTL